MCCCETTLKLSKRTQNFYTQQPVCGQRFSNVFRGYKMGILATNGLMKYILKGLYEQVFTNYEKGVFMALSNIYDGAFLRKQETTFTLKLFCIMCIIDV